MSRRLPLVVLFGFGVVGLILVVTGGESSPALQRIVTADGLEVDVPEGWEPVDERPFEFRPATELAPSGDSWRVAWSCGPEECTRRSLAEWVELGQRLPTFVAARDVEGELLFDVDESSDDSSRVLRAGRAGGGVAVFVAVFHDGSDHYVECGLNVFDDDEGLADAIVEVCRAALPPSN